MKKQIVLSVLLQEVENFSQLQSELQPWKMACNVGRIYSDFWKWIYTAEVTFGGNQTGPKWDLLKKINGNTLVSCNLHMLLLPAKMAPWHSSNVIVMKWFSNPLPSPWNLIYFHKSYLSIILVKEFTALWRWNCLITNYKGIEWMQDYAKTTGIAPLMSFAVWRVSARKKPVHETGKCFKKVCEKAET